MPKQAIASDRSVPVKYPVPPDLLLSRTEVESHFGISKRFLEVTGLKADGPPYIRIGRSVRYRAQDIRAWIDINLVTPGT